MKKNFLITTFTIFCIFINLIPFIAQSASNIEINDIQIEFIPSDYDSYPARNEIKITWNTNEPDRTKIHHKQPFTQDECDDNLNKYKEDQDDAMNHSATVMLFNNYGYFCYQFEDSSGELSPVYSKQLLLGDEIDPEINITDITPSSAIINWTTRIPVTTKVQVYTFDGKNLIVEKDISELKTSHQILINGLSAIMRKKEIRLFF